MQIVHFFVLATIACTSVALAGSSLPSRDGLKDARSNKRKGVAIAVRNDPTHGVQVLLTQNKAKKNSKAPEFARGKGKILSDGSHEPSKITAIQELFEESECR
jgi:hypothetical protein